MTERASERARVFIGGDCACTRSTTSEMLSCSDNGELFQKGCHHSAISRKGSCVVVRRVY